MKNKTEIPAAEAAHAAKQASFALAAAPGKARSSALLAVAAALHAKANMVFKANEIDMRQAEKEGLAAPALKRLKFDAHKLEDVCAGLEQLAAMEDPIGREQLRTELADGLVLSRVSCPIGVIGVIFESRPDALIQIGGLCLKSGNAVLLKGGREAMHTNEALFDILRDASVATGMPDGWCGLLTTREDVSVMLKWTRTSTSSFRAAPMPLCATSWKTATSRCWGTATVCATSMWTRTATRRWPRASLPTPRRSIPPPATRRKCCWCTAPSSPTPCP